MIYILNAKLNNSWLTIIKALLRVVGKGTLECQTYFKSPLEIRLT